MRALLIDWYRENRRDLPWRRRRDAYGIWISEVMLQQTRVDTVIPYYERFLARWPTVADLARADPEAVRAEWSGLGYYRRAKLMLDAARTVVAEHGGEFPRSAPELRSLPGFGPYTAGAVASIAFGDRSPAVDGNVMRVLARIGGILGEPTKKVHALATELAEQCGPHEAGEWTQALMELGATICTPRSPRCDACPVANACIARRKGLVDRIPPPKKRAARTKIELTAAVLTNARGQIGLEQRPSSGLFAELWMPPLFTERTVPGAKPVARVTAVLTHRDLDIEVWAGTLSRGTYRAFSVEELPSLGLPSVAVKILRAGLPPGTITAELGRKRK